MSAGGLSAGKYDTGTDGPARLDLTGFERHDRQTGNVREEFIDGFGSGQGRKGFATDAAGGCSLFGKDGREFRRIGAARALQR